MAGNAPSVVPTAGGILQLIRRGDAVTRAEVAAVTGLSRTAVTARLAALLGAGLIIEGEDAPSTGGRPAAQLRFNAASGVVLAAALGRSRAQMAICDLDGTVLARSEFVHDDGVGPDVMMPRIRAGLDELLVSTGLQPSSVRGVGLSLPGTVDVESGASLSSPIMRGWDGVPLAPYFADLEPVVVHVENDANALALSEMYGRALTFPDLVVLKASTGLGCGIYADGRLIRGAVGAAGEIGHTKVAVAAGRMCRCGDEGCLDAIAAGWALVQESNAGGDPVAHIRELVARAVNGDTAARGRIRESGRRVGEVLAGVVNLLNPGAIVIGGDMGAAYDLFVAGLRETLYAGAAATPSRGLEILPSTHGDAAGIVGCAQAAITDVLSIAAVDAMVFRASA